MTHASRQFAGKGGCRVSFTAALVALTGLASTTAVAGCASDTGEGSPAGDVASACPPRLGAQALPGASGLAEETGFAPTTAGLRMYVYAPSGLPKDPPIVVAMHGCTQSAADYVGAGWNDLADKAKFVVVYPEQPSANHAMRCFRWWLPAHTTRDQGEARAIAAMVARARAKYGGGGKAFVTGLSAGGAMTAAMLAAYPDLFEAGAVMSGLPYGCARTETEAYSCMSPGKDRTPEAWASVVPALTRSKPPRVAIWHGDADWTVRPASADQLVRQWTAVNGVSLDPSTEETVGKAKHAVYTDSSGVPRVESWLVAGMGHGVALSPKAGCGRAGAYMLDAQLCSTERTAVFFGLVAAPGDPLSPGASSPGAPPPVGSSGNDPCD